MTYDLKKEAGDLHSLYFEYCLTIDSLASPWKICIVGFKCFRVQKYIGVPWV